jgi:hypothetical protein
MVPRVRKSASADAVLNGLIADAPTAVIEIFHKVMIVEQSGLDGELLIAVVNDRYDVHLLECGGSTPSILTISDPQSRDDIWVANFPATEQLTRAVKQQLAMQAAAAIDIVVRNVHVVE